MSKGPAILLSASLILGSHERRVLNATEGVIRRGLITHDESTEWALDLIGMCDTEHCRETLVGLVKYSFDGALSESWDCYVAAHGRALLPVIARQSAKSLRSSCERLVAEDGGRTTEGVCAETSAIQRKLKDAREMLRVGGRCPDEDF